MQPLVMGAAEINVRINPEKTRQDMENMRRQAEAAGERIKAGLAKGEQGAVRMAKAANDAGRKIDDSAKKAGQSLETNLTNRLNRLSKGFKVLASTAIGGAATAFLTEFVKRSVEVAAHTQEMENKVNVAFGSMSESVRAWSNEASERLGRSRLTLREYASDLGVVVNGLGVTGETAKKMSTDLSELAVDLGSLFNVQDADAMHAIVSGITGETEGLKRFGVVLNQDALEAQLLADGIKGGADEATEAQKALARYEVILRNTAIAHGDATNTAGSYSNQVKALQEDVKDLANDLGTELIPTMAIVVAGMRGAIPTIRQWGSDFANMAAGVIAAARDISNATEGMISILNMIPRDIQIHITRILSDAAATLNPAGEIISHTGQYFQKRGAAERAHNNYSNVRGGGSKSTNNNYQTRGFYNQNDALKNPAINIPLSGGGSTARRAGGGSSGQSAASHAAEQQARDYERLRESLLTDTERATEKWMQAMQSIEKSTATAAEKTDMIARVNNEFFGNKQISLYTPNAIGNSTIGAPSASERASELARMEEMAKETAKAMADAIASEEAGMKEAFQSTFRDGVRAALDGDFSSFFENWWKDRLSKALEESLNSLSSILYDAMKGGSGSSGGIGGVLASIGSAIFGGKRANGGAVSAGKIYQVNENTPNTEYFMPRTDGAIWNPAQLSALASRSGNQGNIVIPVTFGGEHIETIMVNIANRQATTIAAAGMKQMQTTQARRQSYGIR